MKKIVVIISMFFAIIGLVIAVLYYSNNLEIYDTIVGIFNKNKNVEVLDDTMASFNPVDVNGYIKYEKYSGDTSLVSLLCDNIISEFEVPSNNVLMNYGDTAYDVNGEFYCVLSKGSGVSNVINDNNLGIGMPRVLEVHFDNGYILYIQCYSDESYGFFVDTVSEIEYTNSMYDFSISDENIAKSITLPKDIDSKEYALDAIYVDLVKDNNDTFNGYSDFINYNGVVFTYCRNMGDIHTRIKIEYAKFISLGYDLLSYGNHNGLLCMDFGDVLVIVKSVTSNSCMVYRIAK